MECQTQKRVGTHSATPLNLLCATSYEFPLRSSTVAVLVEPSSSTAETVRCPFLQLKSAMAAIV